MVLAVKTHGQHSTCNDERELKAGVMNSVSKLSSAEERILPKTLN
jgi:hypothetical protein